MHQGGRMEKGMRLQTFENLDYKNAIKPQIGDPTGIFHRAHLWSYWFFANQILYVNNVFCHF
jgi:hypothetical protein